MDKQRQERFILLVKALLHGVEMGTQLHRTAKALVSSAQRPQQTHRLHMSKLSGTIFWTICRLLTLMVQQHALAILSACNIMPASPLQLLGSGLVVLHSTMMWYVCVSII